MGIVLDIIVLAIFILSIILGYRRGLVNVIFSLFAVIIAIVVTLVLFHPLANAVIKNTKIDDNLKDLIIKNGIIKENSESEIEKSNSENGYIEKYISNITVKTANNTIESSAGIIAEKIVSIGVMILLFITIRIVLILLRFIISGIAELPIIKQCDKLGGIIYGIIRGLIIVYIILTILFLVASINNNGMIAETINTSVISEILYKNNIILDIIFKK